MSKAVPVLAVIAAAIALLAASLVPVLWVMLLSWLVFGAAGLLTVRRLPAALRPAAHTAAVGGFTLAWIAGWASPATWPITSILAIAALLLARSRTASAPVRIASTAGGTLLALIAAAPAAEQLVPGVGNAAALGWGIMAALLALGAGVTPRPRGSIDRRLVFWAGLGSAGLVTLGETADAALNGAGPSPLRLTLAALVLFAALIWQLIPANRALRAESSTAGVLVAPTLAWLSTTALQLAGVTDAAPTAIVAAAALVAAASVALFIGKPAARIPLDAGAATTGAIGVLAAITSSGPAWIVLLVGAVAALLLAVSPDGIFGSASARRHIGWASLTLATAALWTLLITQQVSAPEPYVLPLAAALIAIAALTAHAETRRGVDSRGAGWLVGAGLLVAIVPLALTAYAGHELRGMLILAASAALLLIGVILVRGRNTVITRFLHAGAIAGAAGTIIVTVLRSAIALSRNGENLELWLIPGVTALVTAGIVATLLARGARGLGAALVIGGLSMLTLAQLAAVHMTESGNTVLRATATVSVLALAHIIGLLALRSAAIAWSSIGLAGPMLASIAVVDPVELLTAPIALALLTTGAVRLATNPALRSWPWLGPATALLLLPSLLATIGDRPLWRLVGLGIIALAVIIVAVVLRLQAPFILGSLVLLVHAVASLQPQIRAVYELADWYVWAGIGGVLLIALAIRYERRIRDLKKAVSSIRALR